MEYYQKPLVSLVKEGSILDVWENPGLKMESTLAIYISNILHQLTLYKNIYPIKQKESNRKNIYIHSSTNTKVKKKDKEKKAKKSCLKLIIGMI